MGGGPPATTPLNEKAPRRRRGRGLGVSAGPELFTAAAHRGIEGQASGFDLQGSGLLRHEAKGPRDTGGAFTLSPLGRPHQEPDSLFNAHRSLPSIRGGVRSAVLTSPLTSHRRGSFCRPVYNRPARGKVPRPGSPDGTWSGARDTGMAPSAAVEPLLHDLPILPVTDGHLLVLQLPPLGVGVVVVPDGERHVLLGRRLP